MPVEDLAEGILRFVGRVVAQFFVDVVFELLIKGPGYVLAKLLSRSGAKELDPDGFLVVTTGLLFWVVVGVAAYFVYRTFTSGTA